MFDDDDLDLKIDTAWIRRNAPGAICQAMNIPRIPLPNTDRDSGEWCLGIDRKHESSTVLLYCHFGGSRQVYRRIATISTRAELVKLYEHLVGKGTWNKGQPQ